MHKCIHTNIPTCLCMYHEHTYMYICICTYIHTYVHMAKCKMQTVAGQQHAAAGQQRAVACQQHNTGYVHTYSHVHMVSNRIIEKRWQTLSNRQYIDTYIFVPHFPVRAVPM